jgi:hypothetical protein
MLTVFTSFVLCHFKAWFFALLNGVGVIIQMSKKIAKWPEVCAVKKNYKGSHRCLRYYHVASKFRQNVILNTRKVLSE